MPFRVSGKNIDIGQALRARVNARIAEVTAKYFDGGFSGHVTIGKEGFGFRTDCVVHLDSGIVLEADALAADAYASADQAASSPGKAAAPLQAPAQGSPDDAHRRPAV
jgi:ribosomal subunit interface protein